jgi:hypothetical protein
MNIDATDGFRRPPRHFWRRAAAFVIDATAYYLLLICITAIATLVGWDTDVGLFTSQVCNPDLPPALADEVAQEIPLAPGETRANEICVVKPWPGTERRIVYSRLKSRQGSVSITRHFAFEFDDKSDMVPLNEQTTALSPELFQFAFAALFIVGLAQITASGRRSLGKVWLSLRIVTTHGGTPPLRRSLKREAYKFLPFILAPIMGGYLAGLVHTAPLRDMSRHGLLNALVLENGVAFVALIWVFGGFLLWSGQTFYDRVAGCFVVKR